MLLLFYQQKPSKNKFTPSAIDVRALVKNANTLTEAEDVVLYCGSAAEHTRRDAQCCCGSLAPSSGTSSLPGGDSRG